MEHEKVKSYLENSSADVNGDAASSRFFERLIVHGLRVDLVETGRVVCTFKIPRRLLNDRNYLHGGAAAVLVGLVAAATECSAGAPYNGFTVEASLSFMGTAYAGEEIEIEGRVLHVGKAIAVCNVEIRKKTTGKIIVHGRLTTNISFPSKM